MQIGTILKESPLPHLETEILLEHILKKDKSFLHAHSETELTKDQLTKYQNLLDRRGRGEPVQYLTNIAHFYNLNFYVDKMVLIPRQETEDLVDQSLKFIKDSTKLEMRVVDLGTGSGNIIIALANNLPPNKKFELLATDISEGAVEIAQKNAILNHVADKITFLTGDLTAPLTGKFDLITANLPYVRPHLYGVLDKQITWEPKIAILGGDDGMLYYNQLFKDLPKFLNPNGLLLYEIDGRIYEKRI